MAPAYAGAISRLVVARGLIPDVVLYDFAMRIHRSAVTRYLLGATVAVLTSCSSGGSTPHRTTTTSKATTTTTLPAGSAEAALGEAKAILGALHARRPEFCATPNYETNITLPAKRHLPIPVTRGSCFYEGAAVEVIAFALPDDRTKYMQNWTRRICTLSNKGGRNLLGATHWVVNDRSVTLATSAITAETIASIAGGQVHEEKC